MAEPMQVPPRDRITTLILCLFFGSFGMHRFFTGHTGIGLAQLFTAGGCGIWWAVDIWLVASGRYRDVEGRALSG